MRSFLSELKRRNVYKAGAAYAVVGWLVVQIATQVLPVFDVSPLALRVIVLLIAAGFPIVLALSWVYEVTPEGIVRTDEVKPGESIAHHTGRRLNVVIIGVLALAVLLLVAQRYIFPQRVAAPAAAVPDKSIAVLPFENLSEDKANAFFAQGIQDEILTRLAKIGALKVISRTSTQRYASSPDNLPEIARQLGVANILEGSVQKAGDAVHINVQLIHAASDEHLWAEVYNRKLDDIFGVEGEVAGAIADALNAKLSGAEKAAVTDKPTQNIAAVEAYMRGRTLDEAGYGYAVARRQIDAYEEAVRLDPAFARAWAQLSILSGYLYFNGVDPARFTAESVKHATDMAVQLAPELPEVQIAQGGYRYRVLRDYDGAAKALEAAVKERPNSNYALQTLGLVERRQGHWDRALMHLEQAASLDPRNAGLMVVIGGETYSNLRRYDEAREWLDRALALEPHDVMATYYKTLSYVYEGRLEDAEHVLEPAVHLPDVDPTLSFLHVYLRLMQRRDGEAIAEAKALLARPDDSLEGWRTRTALYLALAERRSGHADAARAAFADAAAHAEPMKEQVNDTVVPADLALAYAGAGRNADARKQAQRAVELYSNDAISRPWTEQAQVLVDAMAGDRDAGIPTIELLLKVPCGVTQGELRFDPAWDPFRGDPRFEKLTASAAPSRPVAAPQ
ncbi:MAG TPA: tetratricopeptide repeat protein [Casimicrobiaceae bacterium]|nr:tetratricopeptide repeat protein [Casimicrobiaceae bacterium]